MLSISQKRYQMSLSAHLAERFTSIGEPLALEAIRRQLHNETGKPCLWVQRDDLVNVGLIWNHAVLGIFFIVIPLPDVEALLCLCPWLARITLSTQWQGEWAEAFLNLLYEITSRRSARHGYQIQQIWATIAENRRNVVPILEFLINRSLQENQQHGK